MRRNKKSLKLLFILTLAVMAGGFLFYSLKTEARANESMRQAEYKPGELIIKLKSPGSEATALSADAGNQTELGKIARKLGVTRAKKLFPGANADGANQVFTITIHKDKDVIKAAAEYQKSGLVEYAEPNYVAHMDAIPDDTNYASQWYLHNTGQTGGTPDADIDAQAAWDVEQGETSVVVAVIDSGIDLDHPDLNANIWTNIDEIANNGIDDDNNGKVDDTQGWDYYGPYNVSNVPDSYEGNNDPNPNPDGLDNDSYNGVDSGVNHGTHVAGTIAAETNNGAGVAGVAWDVKLMPLRALDDEGNGYYSDMALALRYAADNGADVVNMSLGGTSYSPTLEDAADYAFNAGVAVIAAAGNSATELTSSSCHYPSCFTNVLCVAATDHDDIASYFTNYGSAYVDISAPGSSIYSTYYYNPTWSFNSYYGSMSGTSMATPVISGVAALLESHNMSLTPTQVYNKLKNYAEDVVTPYHVGAVAADYGTGRVNANDSLGGTPENVDETNPVNPTIKAYKDSNKATEIEFATRTRDATPYFEWTGASDASGIEGYYRYFGIDANANPVTDGRFVSGTSNEPTGLSGNSRYYYLMIRAKDNAGNLADSKTYFSYLVDRVADSPASVTAAMQSGGIKVDWMSGDSHAASYRVYRSETSGGNYVRIGSSSTITDTEYLDTDIDTIGSSINYYYVVKTVDDLGNISDYSDEAEGTYYPQSDLVIGTEDGGAPQVLVYDYEGNLKSQFFAYSSSFRTGVSVAVGDLDGDGANEIITGPGAGGGPQVRVFDMDGNAKITAGFFAYATTVRNGVMVGAGDLDGDGDDEIITGTRAGSGPHVRTFDGEGNAVFSPGFFAYGTNVRNGVFVAACDLNGNGKKEIVTGTDTGSGPHVRTFDRFGTPVFTPGFFAYEETFRGGTRMACGDLNGDGRDEILTIPGEGGGAQVKVFNRYGQSTVTAGFFGFATSWRGGSFISAGDVDQDGLDDIIVSADGGGTPLVAVYNQDGTTLLSSFYGLPATYNAGINVAAGAFPD